MPSNKRNQKALNVYANLNRKRRTNKDFRSRRHAEYLASLPKHPVKRFIYRLHPKRFFAYWFSREGGVMALKIAGVGVLLMVLMVGTLFAYYRRELDAIRPGELSKRVQTTVTKYYDRNGQLLWEDKGDGDYKLVIKSEEIADSMKKATIAIEDKDFYKHAGFSFTGIARAAVSNAQGDGATQGGSTLTQQLVKQVFFADEANNRGLGGIPRKIKEVILSVEVERMYNKDQILTLYLNESPYGGRRNGVESASQTYFGKSAKDLSLAESTLLASIPQLPGLYDPYNIEGHKALIARQHTTLDYMVDQGYIRRSDAETAKKVDVLATIKPETDQFIGIKAPHFVQMVKTELESKLGKKIVGAGGLNIKTTLDMRAQTIVDGAIDKLFAGPLPRTANFDNGAATLVDSQTGQILALRGSRDYNYSDYGAVNASTSFIQPGSSIKPLIYAGLFKQRDGQNYGAGSILADDPLPQSVYRTDDGKSVANFDNRFRGNIPIRSGLAESRNVPAIKAMYINGHDATINTIHAIGDKSYCTQGVDQQVGLAAAIGGCGLKQTEHANAFATFARMGEYKPVTGILEVKNASGQVIQQWKDEGKQVIDPQVAYMLADILSDDAARSPSFGRGASGLNVPGVKTATKTGTSNLGTKSKDLWMNSFTPKAALSIWVGNHDNTSMSNALSSIIGPTVTTIMRDTHVNVFQPEGTWKPGAWFDVPAGLQKLTVSGRTDWFPSWYSKVAATGTTMKFDRVSKKKSTDCTPEAAVITLNVSKTIDRISRRERILAPDGYDATTSDDTHSCDDVKPFVTRISYEKGRLTASVAQGTHPLKNVEFRVDGAVVGTNETSTGGDISVNYDGGNGDKPVVVTVTDTALYTGTETRTIKLNSGGND
ncbi:MAG TPA: transglycosylase domain-containing protein [Candidatus Saccharimonadales bacterium]|jgi:penicillin-binding protein 1A